MLGVLVGRGRVVVGSGLVVGGGLVIGRGIGNRLVVGVGGDGRGQGDKDEECEDLIINNSN